MIKVTYRTSLTAIVLILLTSCSKQEETNTSPAILTVMPGDSYSSALPKATNNVLQTSINLLNTVKTLSVDIGERNIEMITNLDKSANYIKKKFQEYGYQPALNSYQYKALNSYQHKEHTVSNVYAIKPAKNKTNNVIILGAHYDSLSGTVGANDNASGVAVLLELARILQVEKLDTNIHFVAFTNEEPPYFKSNSMGSVVYAKKLRKEKNNVIAMYSLETMGAYYDDKASQHYPYPLGQYYPDVGNFIAFVSNVSSRALLKDSIKIFRDVAKIPSEGLSAPADLEGVSWSDHWAFWQQGYPALMITDTAPFRYKHYHKSTDTYKKIDYIRMSRVTYGISHMIQEMANKKR